MPMLRGDDVVELQRLLTGLGFPMGQIDGIHGQQTTDSLVDFQLNAGLLPDGVCGQETVQVLERLGTRFGRPDEITHLRERQRFLKQSAELHGYKIFLAETGGLDAVIASLRRALTDTGAEVLTSHHPEWGSHAEQANNFDADLCIGIEIRNEGPTVCHFLGDHFESPTGKQLGSQICGRLVPFFGSMEQAGMRLPLLRETRMPALLLRVDDVEALVSSHQAMGAAIAMAIREFVEVGLD